ncbi:mercury resistance system transport protein MerF [Halomonas sp. ML-15]|uniref:mercury resistance system transport protein MerF n=1 Tax=Halomonas sp. ML-15 TaxID=2773305 RepID=UPI0017473DA2|nr:mercury resistance system transport protein MerF [Halomonas sp. ML-15]MBD3895698.1 mercury resistance system transport protein MerF [Halomonas sp. ML-15]
MKNPKTLLHVGLIGSVLVALCCVTPIIAILLTTLGLAALIGHLDLVLLPALAFFIGLTLYALWRKKQCATCNDNATSQTRNPPHA